LDLFFKLFLYLLIII